MRRRRCGGCQRERDAHEAAGEEAEPSSPANPEHGAGHARRRTRTSAVPPAARPRAPRTTPMMPSVVPVSLSSSTASRRLRGRGAGRWAPSSPSSSASVISNAGAGCSSSSASWPSAGISVQAVSPFAQVWTAGNASVSPAFSGSCSESSKASRSPVGQRRLRGVHHAGDPLGHLVAVGVGHRLGELLDLLGHVVVRVAGRGHREDVLRDLDRDLGGRRALTAVRDAHRHHGERARPPCSRG